MMTKTSDLITVLFAARYSAKMVIFASKLKRSILNQIAAMAGRPASPTLHHNLSTPMARSGFKQKKVKLLEHSHRSGSSEVAALSTQ